MKKTKISEDQHFLNQLLRLANEFSEFVKLRQDEIELFELTIYSQNFSIIVHKLQQKLSNSDFIAKNKESLDDLYYYQEFFIRAWGMIEEERMNMSIVQIPINEFLFSEN